MPRTARQIAVGHPHHVTQRGNNKQVTFLSPYDYKFYLDLLERYRNTIPISILAYCLMPNHIHFIAIPHEANALGRLCHIVHTLYSQYCNRKQRNTGHFWQGRYFSCVLDEKHLFAAIRYVEKNPVRANLVSETWQWKWSSFASHAFEEHGSVKLDNDMIQIDSADWDSYINGDENNDFIKSIRQCSSLGKPLGDPAFVQKLESRLNCRFKLTRRGRPRGREWNKNRLLSTIFAQKGDSPLFTYG